MIFSSKSKSKIEKYECIEVDLIGISKHAICGYYLGKLLLPKIEMLNTLSFVAI